MKPNWFVAFPVEGSWFNEWRLNLPEPLRRFHPEDLHITLAFLGPSEESLLKNIKSIMENIDTPRLSITLGPVVYLPRRKSFSAVSLQINEGKKILIESMIKYQPPLLKAAGKNSVYKKHFPHLTVARPPRRISERERREVVAKINDIAIPGIQIKIEEVALYTWSDERPKKQFQKIFKKNLT